MTEDFKAPPAPPGPRQLKDMREDTSPCMYQDHRAPEDLKEIKEMEAFALMMASKGSPAHRVHEENPARKETKDERVKKAFLELLDIPGLRVRKVIGDLLDMVLVLLALLALEVYQDYKEKKVSLALRERQVLQDGLSKGRKEKGV